MKISEVKQLTGCSKKAINYYIECGLIDTDILENGYRDFNDETVKLLKKISLLRKLGLSISEIKDVLENGTQETLTKQKLKLQTNEKKYELLSKLNEDNEDEILNEINSITKNNSILESLLDTFPGYFGRLMTIHFAMFLNDPITTDTQEEAYYKIVEFLDNMDELVLDDDLKKLVDEISSQINDDLINDIQHKTKDNITNYNEFIEDNKEMLDEYIKYKNSQEFLESDAKRLQDSLVNYYTETGYYDTCIPLLKQVSPSYKKYYDELLIANEKLLSEYPEIKNFYNQD